MILETMLSGSTMLLGKGAWSTLHHVAKQKQALCCAKLDNWRVECLTSSIILYHKVFNLYVLGIWTWQIFDTFSLAIC